MANTNYSYVPYQVVENNSQNLRAILFRYLRNWPWFIFSAGLAVIGAYIYLLFQPPIYRIQASLLVKDEKKGINQDNLLKEFDIFAPKKVVENEIEILRSYTLMDKVASHLQLNVGYSKETMFGNREIFEESPVRLIIEEPKSAIYKQELELTFPSASSVKINDQTYPLNQSITTPYGRLRIFTKKTVSNATEKVLIQVYPQTEVVSGYVKSLKAEPTSKSSTVIALSIEDAVPARGEAILNQLINEYNQAAIEDKNLMAANTLKFIEERLKLISGELATVEKDVELYKSAQGITDLSTQAETFLKTAQTNDAQLNQVDIQLGALQDLEKYVKTQSNSGNKGIAPATLGLSDPVLLGLVSKLSELELQREQLARTTSEQNPMLLGLISQIASTKTNIIDNVQTMKNMLTSSREQYLATNTKLESMIRTIPSKERNLLNISRQQAIKNNLYTYLLQKREETAVSFASTISDSRTIDAARSTDKPVKPIKRMYYLLFGLIGLFIPIAVMGGRDAINNRILRRTDVEQNTQVPILGEIVKSKKLEPIVISPRSHSVISEQIRTLRTNLQFLRSDPNQSQVLLFTSSISGEGKSFISLNLGASLSLVGRSTVILEMDLRKPKLHKSLSMAPGIGISNYLIGEASIDQILQPVPNQENYYIITCGPIPPNPSELLSSTRLTELIDELKRRFDYVIIDSPPIGLVTDAQVISPLADATMYIVRHDVTPKNYVKMLGTLYKEQRFQKLNIILNAVSEGDAYYYGYSYSDYYGETTKKKKRLGSRS